MAEGFNDAIFAAVPLEDRDSDHIEFAGRVQNSILVDRAVAETELRRVGDHFAASHYRWIILGGVMTWMMLGRRGSMKTGSIPMGIGSSIRNKEDGLQAIASRGGCRGRPTSANST